MASELVKNLVESGVHFGHRASRWNPKMKPYIFGKRNTIHIIDIRETVKGLLRAKKFLSQVVAGGQDVLFVGTKRQARSLVQHYATQVGMPYVSERWLGGTLTNFRTIRLRLSRLEELEREQADGTSLLYSKKMIATRARELDKIKRNLDGIRKMTRMPGALAIIDPGKEYNALREARACGVPTVGLIDTDSDPDLVDLPIPGNDDAMRSIELLLKVLSDAVTEGLKGRVEEPEKAPAAQDGRPPRRQHGRGGGRSRTKEAQQAASDHAEAGGLDAPSSSRPEPSAAESS